MRMMALDIKFYALGLVFGYHALMANVNVWLYKQTGKGAEHHIDKMKKVNGSLRRINVSTALLTRES